MKKLEWGDFFGLLWQLLVQCFRFFLWLVYAALKLLAWVLEIINELFKQFLK